MTPKNSYFDSLDADYTYDAVYRLIAATGREHLGQKNDNREPIPIGHDDSLRMNRPHPNDEKAMGRYQQEYLYDEVGNILKTIHKGTDPAHPRWTRTYSYNEPSLLDGSKKNNRLSSTTLDQVVEDYLHDAHGNIERMPHLASHADPKKPNMRWDFEDQLCQVDLAGGGTAFYVYDAEGQRVRKVIHRQNGTRHKERIYLGEFEIYREYEGNGDGLKLERETLHVMDDEQRIALVETKTFERKEDGSGRAIASPEPVIRYQLGNHLGSASLELDKDGEVISYEEYYPYGSTSYQAGRNQAKVSLKRYRYTGKERDEESGFYYHGARYYAGWLGRWISTDPIIALEGGINLYSYALNNPVNSLDSTGEQVDSLESPSTFTEFLKGLYYKFRRLFGWHRQPKKTAKKTAKKLLQGKTNSIPNITMGGGPTKKMKKAAEKGIELAKKVGPIISAFKGKGSSRQTPGSLTKPVKPEKWNYYQTKKKIEGAIQTAQQKLGINESVTYSIDIEGPGHNAPDSPGSIEIGPVILFNMSLNYTKKHPKLAKMWKNLSLEERVEVVLLHEYQEMKKTLSFRNFKNLKDKYIGGKQLAMILAHKHAILNPSKKLVKKLSPKAQEYINAWQKQPVDPEFENKLFEWTY